VAKWFGSLLILGYFFLDLEDVGIIVLFAKPLFQISHNFIEVLAMCMNFSLIYEYEAAMT
jgi:hypothetical protein